MGKSHKSTILDNIERELTDLETHIDKALKNNHVEVKPECRTAKTGKMEKKKK